MARGAKRHALPRPGWLRLVGVVCGNKAGDVDEGLRGAGCPASGWVAMSNSLLMPLPDR